MIIRYIGYQPKFDVRTYSFWVVDASKRERQFAVTISNSLMTNVVKYQDAPDLCFSKLKHALAFETPESPVPLQMKITDADLRQYQQEHLSKKGRLSRS